MQSTLIQQSLSPSNSETIASTIAPTQLRRNQLRAIWQKVDGKLICQWATGTD